MISAALPLEAARPPVTHGFNHEAHTAPGYQNFSAVVQRTVEFYSDLFGSAIYRDPVLGIFSGLSRPNRAKLGEDNIIAVIGHCLTNLL